MTEKDYIIILKSMGYRQLKPDVWGKPIGFNLFTFEFINFEWTNWFKGAYNSGLQRYNADNYGPPLNEDTPKRFLEWLKCCESYTQLQQLSSEFEFNTFQEQYELGL